MVLSNISINRPVFTVMVTIALMTLGVLAYRTLGVDLFPDVTFPIVTVQTIYPGAGPDEVEQQVSKRIEDAVSSINGVDTVRSTSRDSVSFVFIQFKLETDVKAAATDVREHIAAIRSLLPQDVKDPLVERIDPTAMPIVTYAVSSNRDPAETKRFATDVIKPKIEAVDGVASVNVLGGLDREIHIFVDRQKLDAISLGLAQISQQLQSEGFDLPAGHLTTGGSELDIKTVGRFRTLDDLGNMVVASLPTGAQVKLKDVARIEDGFKEVRTITRLDGKPAVMLEIQKQAGSNTVAVADNVYKVMDNIHDVVPADVQVKKAIDSSVYIRRNIEDVTRDILFGGAMAILVIFLFMLDWRSTLISSLSLPTSVITTFFAMWYLGFTLNMMSLLALSLSIGLLIDDAVVVRENIFRHMQMGKDPITAAKEATSEIGLAVMATTFTIVAVFVPVAFMGGLIGRMFKQFGLTVAAAVLVSLFVSFTLDPMMSARVMKPVKPGHHEEQRHHPIYGPIIRAYDNMDLFYRAILKWVMASFGRKIFVILAAVGLFGGTLYLTKFMGKDFVPPTDRGEFLVDTELPAGTSLAESDRVTTEVEAAIRRSSKEITSLYVVVGPGEETNKAKIRVYCTKSLDRPGISQWDIEDAIRHELRALPNLKFQVTDLGMIEGPFIMAPINLNIRGDDYEKLQAIAQEVLAAVKAMPGAADADMSYRAGKAETDVRIDRSKAADLGVGVGAIAQTLRLAIEGEVVAKYQGTDHDYDIRLQLDPNERRSVTDIEQLTVPVTQRRLGAGGPGAGLVDLRQVAQVVTRSGPATIERENRQRQIVITANLSKNASLGEVTSAIQAKIDSMKVPPGFGFSWVGQAKDMKDTFFNMAVAFAVAVLFIFFVLASQFESIIHPFTIMLSLPLAIVGGLLLLFLTGKTIGMAAAIGFILLMGLVTKNAILLVDYTNELRARGYKAVEALLEAGPTRLRPILMTSAAMTLGMLPGALSRGEGSEFRSPMAVAVIGGVIASTLLTLIVVPIGYSWMDFLTKRGREEHRAAKAAAPEASTPPREAVPAAALVATDPVGEG